MEAAAPDCLQSMINLGAIDGSVSSRQPKLFLTTRANWPPPAAVNAWLGFRAPLPKRPINADCAKPSFSNCWGRATNAGPSALGSCASFRSSSALSVESDKLMTSPRNSRVLPASDLSLLNITDRSREPPRSANAVRPCRNHRDILRGIFKRRPARWAITRDK